MLQNHVEIKKKKTKNKEARFALQNKSWHDFYFDTIPAPSDASKKPEQNPQILST